MKTNASLSVETLSISSDGHIRLRLAELQDITMHHLVSGLDEDFPEAAYFGALHTTISGYTEWVSHTSPVISIGWDWQMLDAEWLLRTGEPRSNLLFLDTQHSDMNYLASAVMLEEFVDTLDWQAEVFRQISERYSWQ